MTELTRDGIVLTVSGACPCCGESLASMHHTWGGDLLCFYHEDDDLSRTLIPLEDIRLCNIRRTTGKRIRRNYELPEKT